MSSPSSSPALVYSFLYVLHQQNLPRAVTATQFLYCFLYLSAVPTIIHLIYFIPWSYFISLLRISSEFLFTQSHPHSSPSLPTIPSNHPSVQSSPLAVQGRNPGFYSCTRLLFVSRARQTRSVRWLWKPNLWEYSRVGHLRDPHPSQ
jgi:hypothetical protein